MLKPISPEALSERLTRDEVILIDIREPMEYRREHIRGARLVPLNTIDTHDFDHEKQRVAVFTCRSGNRTAMNSARLLAKGFADAYVLAGGLDAWKKQGLPVHFDPGAPIDLQRQVQMTAGGLALLGALLAWLVNPSFIALSGFIGAGLVFSGATGLCPMARFLAAMPWNRKVLAA